MAQSDARFGYQAKLNREDHNLSQSLGFTCAPGMLLPVFEDIATPGDTYYIHHDLNFMRTAPLIAPSMIDVKVHFDSYFVPMQMIYQPFENAQFSLQEILSSNYTVANFRNQELPRMSYSEVEREIGAGSDYLLPPRFEAYRLFNMLNLPCDHFCGKELFSGNDGTGFPWALCAYQCIWQHVFRLDDKDSFNHDTFNLDRFYASSDTITDNFSSVAEMFYLRYRPWGFDYFTSSYRSPIVSAAGTLGILPQGKYNELINFTTQRGVTMPVGQSGAVVSSNSEISAYTSDFKSEFGVNEFRAQVSTAMIRQMFANEKLAMITGRTKKNYDSQVLAHFGVNVPHDIKHDVSFIGHDEFTLKVGEVTSLASTDASPLGELAGKGWALGQGERKKFTAPCHGVVMTLFSVEPIVRYEDSVSRLSFITSALQIPQPEFDRLGNEPMFGNEIARSTGSASDIVAWKERYYAFKRRYPRVTKAFNHQGKQVNKNNYSAYFIHMKPFGQSPQGWSLPANPSSYYINPYCMNDLMLVNYISLWQNGGDTQGQTGEDWDAIGNEHLPFARDPFIVDSNVRVKKVSWMSKDGEPIYPY